MASHTPWRGGAASDGGGAPKAGRGRPPASAASWTAPVDTAEYRAMVEDARAYVSKEFGGLERGISAVSDKYGPASITNRGWPPPIAAADLRAEQERLFASTAADLQAELARDAQKRQFLNQLQDKGGRGGGAEGDGGDAGRKRKRTREAEVVEVEVSDADLTLSVAVQLALTVELASLQAAAGRAGSDAPAPTAGALRPAYVALGLHPGRHAPGSEGIKRRYRALALLLHPDKAGKAPNGAGDSEEAFKRVAAAYALLQAAARA